MAEGEENPLNAHRGLPWGNKRRGVPSASDPAEAGAPLSHDDAVAAGLVEGPGYRDFPGEERAFDHEALDDLDRHSGAGLIEFEPADPADALAEHRAADDTFWEELSAYQSGGYF